MILNDCVKKDNVSEMSVSIYLEAKKSNLNPKKEKTANKGNQSNRKRTYIKEYQ